MAVPALMVAKEELLASTPHFWIDFACDSGSKFFHVISIVCGWRVSIECSTLEPKVAIHAALPSQQFL